MTAARQPTRQTWGTLGLAMLVAAHVLLHGWLQDTTPPRRQFGDEGVYAAQALRHADEGHGTLLPGRLEFSKRPPFWGHVLSRLSPPPARDARGRIRTDARRVRHTYQIPATRLHVMLSSVTLVALYLQARLLGVGPLLALLAPLLLALLPRVGFHIHALWAETLHMTLQTLVLTLALACARRPRVWLGAAIGVALGYAVLTRTTGAFLLVWIPAWLLGTAWWGARRAGAGVRPHLRAAIAVLVFGAAVVVPQAVANQRAGAGFRLAANNWTNIRHGLHAGKSEPPRLHRAWAAAQKAGADTRPLHPNELVRREDRARAQVLAFAGSLPATTLLRRQARRTWAQMTRGPSQFAYALMGKNWPPAQKKRFAPARDADAKLWRWLVWLGAAGLLAGTLWPLRRLGWLLPTGYASYYAVALMAVPIGARMCLQLAPVLCLGACGLLAAAVALGARRASPLTSARAESNNPSPLRE